MKKQKLIEKINKIAIETPFLKSKIVDHLEVIKLIEQLDEPEKVKVPQFVADFITEQKKLGYTLSCSIDASMSDRVAEWYWNNFGLFASAWLYFRQRYILPHSQRTRRSWFRLGV